MALRVGLLVGLWVALRVVQVLGVGVVAVVLEVVHLVLGR